MADQGASRLGNKVRALRRQGKLSQGELASRLGISASYLNLIENNHRPLPAALLIRLAQLFQVQLSNFDADEESRLSEALFETFSDPLFEEQDASFFCIARTVQADNQGYHTPPRIHAIGLGCALRHARELVYADGLDLTNLEAAVPVGLSCRVCERTTCEQRAFPSVHRPLPINATRRGVSLYAPLGGDLDVIDSSGSDSR